jgi:CheY-like chemotaxis protein
MVEGSGPTQHAGSIRVLVVDDNVDAAETLALYLQSHGYTTHVAHDGETALVMAQDLRPQVVLLDLGLPKYDGYEVASMLRTKPWAQDIWICAITAWGSEADREIAFAAGFDHHLVKPVEAGAVLNLIRASGAGERE